MHRETRVRFSVDERWCARNAQERHGLYTAWHVTGGEGKRVEGRFRNDLRSGGWQRWDDSGILRWQVDYPKDAVVGDASLRPAVATGALRSLAGVPWSFPLDCGSSRQPIVVGDLAITACGEESLARSPRPARIYAVDLQTGREVWRHDLSPVKLSSPHPRSLATWSLRRTATGASMQSSAQPAESGGASRPAA